MLKKALTVTTLAILTGCASDGSFSPDTAVVLAVGAAQLAMIDESQVKNASALSAKEMDSKSPVAGPSNPYSQRLARITKGLHNWGGLNLNFKVYLDKKVNAFAMADGTVRIHAGLMDVMPDDQVLAVIFHEIGHVKGKHTYKQMREQIVTNTVFQSAITSGGTLGQLTNTQLGQLGYLAANAHFSQSDELEADAYAVKSLRYRKMDPYAMLRAIQTLEKQGGKGGGFLSSHPTNADRIANIKRAIEGS